MIAYFNTEQCSVNIGYFIELVTTNYGLGRNPAIRQIMDVVVKMIRTQNSAALQRVLCILPQHVSGAQTHSQHDILQHELLQS